MKKKILAIVLCIGMLAIAVAGGTMAYFTDTDDITNVMAAGSVEIEQHEQERTKDAEGNFTGELQDFTQNQPIFPAVGEEAWSDDKNETGIVVGNIEYKAYHSGLKNVLDKIVTVENTGKSDAYIRTIVVLEAPDYDAKNLINVNVNLNEDVVSWSAWTPVDMNDTQYIYSVCTYLDSVAAGETTEPSLVQIFLDRATTNEDVEEYGDSWEVLVLSQAVQAAGFPNAATALDEAFGAADAINVADWFSSFT